METNNPPWERRVISSGQARLEARVRAFDTPAACDGLLQREKSAVTADGGALFCHIDKPPLEEVRTPGIPGVGYRYGRPAAAELWYLPRCTFQELLEASRFFGFPSRVDVDRPDAVFETVRSFLIAFHHRKPLVITQIEDSHIMLELVRTIDRIEQPELSEIIEFNRTNFGVHETRHEERDKRLNWMKRRFFTVGAL